MFIQVRLLNGFAQALWYKVPSDWPRQDLLHCVVRVPLKNKSLSAVVCRVSMTQPSVSFQLREADQLEVLPADNKYQSFINFLAYYYQIDHLSLLRRMRQFLLQSQEMLAPIAKLACPEHQFITLTEEQQVVVDALSPAIIDPVYYPVLLHGVTGSGKTEVYKKLIQLAYAQQKTTFLLLPEVSLAVNFEWILRKQLPGEIQVFGFHSATSVKDKNFVWKALLNKMPIVIVGVHLPVLLPVANLGLIIIDEEHDTGFEEKKYPRINSKDAAISRAQHYKIPILLGSATPSISSLFKVKTKGWHFFQLKKRFGGEFPAIEVIRLNDRYKRRNFWISSELDRAIQVCLERKQQAILFLNRRGVSFFVQCKKCNFVFHCNQCSVSLTLHDDLMLRCHYCGFSLKRPSVCMQCKTDEKHFLNKGVGTQQLVSILQKLFPQARIARADADATINKKKWQQTLENFQQGELDILVGTQTITKGYHFSRVSLVGIVWADLNLHFPVFNASEVTLQQLVQVAGRAGRELPGSRVIVQTLIDHPIFTFLNEVDYLKFYARELQSRATVLYPPVIIFVEIDLKHENEEIVEQEAQLFVVKLMHYASQQDGITVLGPSKPLIHIIKKICTRKIYLKGYALKNIIAAFQYAKEVITQSSVSFTPNPLH